MGEVYGGVGWLVVKGLAPEKGFAVEEGNSRYVCNTVELGFQKLLGTSLC